MSDDPELDEWKRTLSAPFDTEAACDVLEEIARDLPPRRLPDGLLDGSDAEDERRCGGCGRRLGHPLCALSDQEIWR